MSDEDPLSDLDRRSLRILARSAKSNGTNERLSTRLQRAAETGAREDYEKAETTFDSLEPEQRRKIGSTAEAQAETERKLALGRRRRRPAPPPAPAASDEPLEWTALFKPAQEEPASRPFPEESGDPELDAASDRDEEPQDMNWKLGRMPGNPEAPNAKQQSGQTPPVKIESQSGPDLDDDGKDWDWRQLPEDPVMGGGKKKKRLDPIEQLRQEMLGLEAKQRTSR